jgi:hypothetical protein
MKQNQKKYKINQFLLSLSVSEYRRAMRIIPKILGISLNTFHNYRNMDLDAKQDMPYAIVVRCELLFEMEPGFLFNGAVKQLPLKSLLKREPLPKSVKTNKKNGQN